MLRSLLFYFLSSLLISSYGNAQSGLYRSDEGSVNFTSDAPLELIQASSQVLKGVVDPTQNTFAFSIDIKSFQGFNSELQKTHFNENYLESHKYPRATFSGKVIEKIDWDSEGKFEIRAKGILDIHGIKQERIILSIVELFPERALIRSEFTVLLEEHEIDIPKIVAQKISEEIDVAIEISLTKQPSN